MVQITKILQDPLNIFHIDSLNEVQVQIRQKFKDLNTKQTPCLVCLQQCKTMIANFVFTCSSDMSNQELLPLHCSAKLIQKDYIKNIPSLQIKFIMVYVMFQNLGLYKTICSYRYDLEIKSLQTFSPFPESGRLLWLPSPPVSP